MEASHTQGFTPIFHQSVLKAKKKKKKKDEDKEKAAASQKHWKTP